MSRRYCNTSPAALWQEPFLRPPWEEAGEAFLWAPWVTPEGSGLRGFLAVGGRGGGPGGEGRRR